MATIKTVGIIGAGQMGAGIAHVCALAGYDVLLHDVSSERIETCAHAPWRNFVHASRTASSSIWR